MIFEKCFSEFCVGSRLGEEDDVVKMKHKGGSDMEVTFKDGRMTAANHSSYNISEVVPMEKETKPRSETINKTKENRNRGIHLEPGK